MFGFALFMPLHAEPGYYQDGEFGIRIEDVMCSVKAETEVSYTKYNIRYPQH